MLIRRTKEADFLMDSYKKLLEDKKLQLRFISGEAGTGKTTLANMFLDEALEREPQTIVVTAYCSLRSEYSIPYQPFKELLKQLLTDVECDEGKQRTQRPHSEKIKDALMFSTKMFSEYAPDLLASFLPGVSALAALGKMITSNVKEKEVVRIDESKIVEQYIEAIRNISKKYRIVMVIDDLQWMDSSSVHLLYQLIKGLKNSQVLFLGMYRSTDIDVKDSGEKHLLSPLITEVKIDFGDVFIMLDRLAENERQSFTNSILDRDSNMYDDHFRRNMFERTNGNPLFICELLALLKEEGVIHKNQEGIWVNHANLQWKSYPVRIEGIIQERIGKLEEEMVQILSHASVQGYRFIAQVLSRTMGSTDKEILITLSKKLQKEHHLITETSCTRAGKGMVSSFNFSNYIFQQYLYEELSMTERMMLHNDIAEILEDLYKDKIEEVSVDLARHYEVAGDHEKAIKYMHMAAGSMMKVSAFQNASVLLSKALEMIPSLENSDNVNQIRLDIEVKRCICNRYLLGWGNSELALMYQKLKRLSEEWNDYRYFDTISFGIWTVHLTRLELEKCLDMANHNLDMAQQLNNTGMIKSSLVALVNTLFWMGKSQEAQNRLDEYQQLENQGSETHTEDDQNRILTLMFSYLVAQLSNNRDELARLKSQLKGVVKESKNQVTICMALQALAWNACVSDEPDEMAEFAPAFLDVASRLKMVFYEGMANIFNGYYQATIDYDKGIANIKKGYKMIQDHNQCEVVVTHSLYGLLLSRCYLKNNEYDSFQTFVNMVITTAEARGELVYINLLYQLKNHVVEESSPLGHVGKGVSSLPAH